MKYCPNCGKEVDPNAFVCVHCGVKLQNTPTTTGADNDGFVWGLLGFLIPLVGLILYLMWKDTKPNTAKSAGKGALISVIIMVVLYILIFMLALAEY